MRGWLSSRLVLVASMVVVLAGCAEQTSADIERQPARLVEEGERVYMANCAECHGEDLEGTDTGPSFLSIVYEPSHHGDGSFRIAVIAGVPQHHWGFGAMPPVSGLSDADIEGIVAFVRETQRVKGFDPYPP